MNHNSGLMITVTSVKNKKDLKRFIHLPFNVHKDHKQWLPPLISDEWKVFDKTQNHSFDTCETVLFLAQRAGQVVGRIMGIINPLYNKAHGEKAGRFCFVECYDDAEVFDALIQAVENWAQEKGMEKLVGPLGFSDKDPQGFLIEGFEDPMTVMVTNCSLPYMINHTERNGYEKKLDLVQYRIDTPEIIPEVYKRVAERVQNHGFDLVGLKKSKEMRPYIQPVFDLINETYTDIYGFAPLTETESKEFSERFLPLLNPEYIQLVKDKEGQLAAFMVAMPNISKGFKKANGRLFPFGFIHILRALKTARQLDLLLGCVKTKYQNSGLDALMAVSQLEAARKGNLDIMDSHVVMEENTKMRAIYERLGGRIYKRYRIFEKKLGRI